MHLTTLKTQGTGSQFTFAKFQQAAARDTAPVRSLAVWRAVRLAASGWDKSASGWERSATAWDKSASAWDKSASGWDKSASGWDKSASEWDKSARWVG